MKTGKTVTKNEIEDHLDNDNWIEVFQDGSAEDMLFVQGIAATDRTYSKAIAVEGQPSPLLIRLSAYVRATQRTACPVPAGSANDLLADRPFYARYKQRDPDPGVCRITTIDWENRSISMSNECCRYFPSFDEVEIVPANLIYQETY